MNSGKGAAAERDRPSALANAIARLQSPQSPDGCLQDARALLDLVCAYCAGPVDITVPSAAADALLAAINLTDPNAQHNRELAAVAHRFIDLARLNTVRQAAYPADAGCPGGLWFDRIIQLIDRTDFTLARMFRQRAAQYPNKTLFTVPHWERVTEYSWERVARITRQMACGILALTGDNPRVAIFTPNRIEGALIDLACLTNGIFNAVIPVNVVESQLQHILFESGARMLVVAGMHQVQKAFAALNDLPSLEWVVTLDALPTVPGAKVMTLAELMALEKEVPIRALEERAASVRSGDVATTMYTSGTSGVPKGIKFSHLNLVSKRFARAAALPAVDEREVFICYLPLYHTFGRYLEMLGSVHLAATYVFAENSSTGTLVRHMQQFSPTALIGVPKKWIDLHRRITGSDQPPVDSGGLRRTLNELTGGRLRWGLSAAGRLGSAVFRFFQNLGVDLLSGYGMTEATGGITMTPPGQYVDDSIGKALPAIELALHDDNELMLRGPYVTVGYSDPKDDAAAFRNGWLCTGDIVARDPEGHLKHVDRKKDIYKNASGRTVAPQRVEALFADLPEVSRVFAVGDGRDYVTLLIRPNLDDSEVALIRASETVRREYFRGLVVACNRFLSPFERAVKFALIDRDFSLERREITPKGSFRRSVVERNFSNLIDDLYASSTVERVVDRLRVRIPVTFLQHLGVTETDIRTDADGLLFSAIGMRLRIQRDADIADRVWIGNCCYDAVEDEINLDDWLRLPELWVGNAELTHLTGESILFWSLSANDRATRSRMVSVGPCNVPIDGWQARLDSSRDAAPSLLTVHAAAVMVSSPVPEVALQAVHCLAHVITAGRVRYEDLAASRLQQFSRHPEPAVRSRAFVALWECQPAVSFGETALLFCESLLDFLDDRACERIASLGLKPEHWLAFHEALGALRRKITLACSGPAVPFAVRLFPQLRRIADLGDDYYLPVCRELTSWTLAPVPKRVCLSAAGVIERLQGSFRRRLETRQEQAVDPQTGRSYGWQETLRLEDGIDSHHAARMTDAVLDTDLVREAVYLLHHKRRIDLSDLGPGSVWISLVGTWFGRSIYHAGVRLRGRERCDFTLSVMSTASPDAFVTDLRLMSVAAGGPGETLLTPRVVGYWPEYGLATMEHVPGESVESLARHMHEHPDREVRQRLTQSWKHLSWSAITAAFEFHRRTEGRWMLGGTVARDITVPLDDFEERTRILPTAGWCPFSGPLNMLLGLKRSFLDRVRFHFPVLAADAHEDVLFAAALEAFGVQEGLAFLKDAIAEAKRVHAPDDDEAVELGRRLEAYMRYIGEVGYMPKALYFAIRRYHAWSRQVPDASIHARAAQLRQLERNYRTDALSRKFPGVRLWLYAETVLEKSPDVGRRTIERAIHHLRGGAEIKEALGRLYRDLKSRLPSYDDQYFLARAVYPHLDPDEKAQLVTTAEVGPARAELVTSHVDRAGRVLEVRPVANSTEMDALYRVFYAGGIGGGLIAHEEYLVAVDQAGHVIGGVAYVRRTPNHALLDKIAVLPRCRGRGVGRLLLCEFLRRQAAEGVAVVSAQFIRADRLAQFGFRSHARYAGVVRSLADTSQPAVTAQGDASV